MLQNAPWTLSGGPQGGGATGSLALGFSEPLGARPLPHLGEMNPLPTPDRDLCPTMVWVIQWASLMRWPLDGFTFGKWSFFLVKPSLSKSPQLLLSRPKSSKGPLEGADDLPGEEASSHLGSCWHPSLSNKTWNKVYIYGPKFLAPPPHVTQSHLWDHCDY